MFPPSPRGLIVLAWREGYVDIDRRLGCLGVAFRTAPDRTGPVTVSGRFGGQDPYGVLRTRTAASRDQGLASTGQSEGSAVNAKLVIASGHGIENVGIDATALE